MGNTLNVVVIAEDRHSEGFSIKIPDLNIIALGRDFNTAMLTAKQTATAVYYYNLDRDVKIDFNTTYNEAESKLAKDTQFVTFLGIAT